MFTPQAIRELRVRLQLSATELAYALGVTEDCVRKWEAGVRHPRYRSLVRLSELAAQQQLLGKIG